MSGTYEHGFSSSGFLREKLWIKYWRVLQRTSARVPGTVGANTPALGVVLVQLEIIMMEIIGGKSSQTNGQLR